MRTALDSSVLLDVVTAEPRFVDASERVLRRASAEGSLVLCECVIAEIGPAFEPGALEEFLGDLDIEFMTSTRESALLAGEMFRTYLERRSRANTKSRASAPRVPADFLIGAHAVMCADRLLARDRGFYRDYFQQLPLLEP